jgi:hypothetical protein
MLGLTVTPRLTQSGSAWHFVLFFRLRRYRQAPFVSLAGGGDDLLKPAEKCIEDLKWLQTLTCSCSCRSSFGA